MIPAQKRRLQKELLELFERYDVNVSVGLTKEGVALRSQDEAVDAKNIGPVHSL